MRIGHGYDVHKLVPDRDLILGGIIIPYEKGLLGHSDADVLTHALMDALLGAMAVGDIGRMFPDSDDRYLNADSIEMLREVVKLVKKKGFVVVNIDCTVIAQRPKLQPYVGAMRAVYADVLGIDIGRVSVKATTEEHLGFTGEGLGVAAHAMVLID